MMATSRTRPVRQYFTVSSVNNARVALSAASSTTGLQTMKKVLLKDIDARFGDIPKEPLYAVAMLVDPHYHGKLLSADDMDTAT